MRIMGTNKGAFSPADFTSSSLKEDLHSQSCSVASSLWCLQIKMEGLPSHMNVFIIPLATCFGPDRPPSDDT
jgi:hypothetical protein